MGLIAVEDGEHINLPPNSEPVWSLFSTYHDIHSDQNHLPNCRTVTIERKSDCLFFPCSEEKCERMMSHRAVLVRFSPSGKRVQLNLRMGAISARLPRLGPERELSVVTLPMEGKKHPMLMLLWGRVGRGLMHCRRGGTAQSRRRVLAETPSPELDALADRLGAQIYRLIDSRS